MSSAAPFMNENEVRALECCFRSFATPLQVVEWGSGTSTVYFSQQLPPGSSWTAIEHNGPWAAKVEQMVAASPAECIRRVVLVPNDAPFNDGVDDGDIRSFRTYIRTPRSLEQRFDVVLVDGRARVDCMREGWQLLREGGVMILHDAHRVEYQRGIPEDACTVRMTNTLVDNGEGPIAVVFMVQGEEQAMALFGALAAFLPPFIRLQTSVRSIDTIASAVARPVAERRPSCLFVNTYYAGFLSMLYERTPALAQASYGEQFSTLQGQFFGDSDFYSRGLRGAGWDAQEIIANCAPLQQAWARENGFGGGAAQVALEQIRRLHPDVVYLQDLNMATADFMSRIRPHTSLIVGQIASPLPANASVRDFDIIISSFPHFVKKLREAGICSYYQPLAFDERVLGTSEPERDIDVSFVGGISAAHARGLELLEYLAKTTPIQFYGYGAAGLDERSAVRMRHGGEAWGAQMFGLLQRSSITVNRHIDVAENNANNMRLFEATGCGALLITDYKDNLHELFDIGSEIVAYRSPQECAALVNYYHAHPQEAQEIARAGQRRTLRDHSYTLRMQQTASLLQRHLRHKRDVRIYSQLDAAPVSTGYQSIQKANVTTTHTSAWQSESIPLRQRALVQQQLEGLYHGRSEPIFSVLAKLLKARLGVGERVVEIGCASGYYREIMEYLLSRSIDYVGVDYSVPLVSQGRSYYPQAALCGADGGRLPFVDKAFEVAISSCILLHIPDYATHIAETCRVAKNHVMVHRTPVCRKRPTQYFIKKAYGIETVELVFNEAELVRLFEQHGLTLVEGMQYHAREQDDYFEVSYVFSRNAPRHMGSGGQAKSSEKPSMPAAQTSTTKVSAQAAQAPSDRLTSSHRRGPVVLVSREIAFTFPLSYAYLAGYLKAMGEEVVVLFKDGDHASLVKRIMALNPLMVGLGNLYPELKETRALIHMLNHAGRRFPVVIGGQMVSPTPQFAVEITGADIGVIGEGEVTLLRLAQALREGGDCAAVGGIALRQGGTIQLSGPGACVEDLDTLPPLPYELFPTEKWLPIGKWYAQNCPQPLWRVEDRVINVHGGRGCPFTCNFCYHHSKPRYRSLPVMFAEAAAALERFDGNMLYFSDDLVLVSPRRAGQLVEQVRLLKRPISYSVSTRFDNLVRMSDELLGQMQDTGCRIMGLGIESGSDRMLQLIGKNTTGDEVLTQLERLKRFGIYPSVSMMVGQYTETEQDVADSIRVMKESVRVNPDIQYAFTIMTPFPGSELYTKIFEQGLLRDDREFYDRYFATSGEWKQVVNLSAMSEQQVLRAHQQIQQEYVQAKQAARGA